MTEALERLRRRLRQHQGRVAVRRWAYRQRHLAKGVWPRLRRILADAAEARLVSAETAAALAAEGYEPELAPLELRPPRTWILIPPHRAATLLGARPVEVRLGADLLDAEHVVLIRFPKNR